MGLIESFYKINFLKIMFKGKGYYIYKNKRNTVAAQLNYSHCTYIYVPFLHLKFISKTKILLYGLNWCDLKYISWGFRSYRVLNIFTGRGIRFSKQIILKKIGKISSYH